MRRSAVLLVLAGTLVQGCGGGSDEDPFVGVWTGTGNVNTRCGMGEGMNSALNETITITKGVNAPLLVVVGDCPFR